MVFRDATILDIGVISQMWRDMHEEIKTPFLVIDDEEVLAYAEYMCKAIKNDLVFVGVAELGGVVVGYTHTIVSSRAYGKPRVSIYSESTYVLPEFRKGGTASRLTNFHLEKCGKVLAGVGDVMVQLSCLNKQHDIDKYNKLGFKISSVVMERKESWLQQQ